MESLILIFLCVIVCLWLAGLLYTNDFSVPAGALPTVRKALIIFPHADDETNVAGFVWRLHITHTAISMTVLTLGENGTPDAHQDLGLQSVREAEMRAICNQFGSTLIQKDFGDGQLDKKTQTLTRYIRQLIQAEHPNLVITYDPAGMYGHPDHVACTEVVTKVLQQDAPHIQLWYVTFLPRVLTAMNLPVHMAHDPHFSERRAVPDRRIFIGRGVFAKTAAIYHHKSQRDSFRKSMPFHLPIWLVYAVQPFEYYKRIQ